MIWFLLKLLYTKWLNIIRWSNYPKIENISPLDNTGFVIHTALFLVNLEEKEWNKIDSEYIIKKILFDMLFSLILSDINSWTRNYIMDIDKQVLNKINNKVIEYILSMKWWEFLKNDIINIINAKNKELENDIILAARKYVWYSECLVNSKVFDFTYDKAMQELTMSLNKQKVKLNSLNILLKTDNYKNYLSHIRRLIHCKRWSWAKRNYAVSVMSHLVIVTFISYVLWNFENISWEKYNIYEMMLKSLYHDIPEAITWDIITPTKHSIKWFKEILEKVETQMLNDYFFVYINKNYKNQIQNYLLHPFDDYEWKLTKKSDIISALYEALIEKESWNPEFNSIYKKLKNMVKEFELNNKNYFLNQILSDFKKDYSNIDFSKNKDF